MRVVLLVFATMLLTSNLVVAQGTRDPANFGGVATQPKTQSFPETGRPTAVQNVPANMLPPGTAIQRTYKDGKLQSNYR